MTESKVFLPMLSIDAQHRYIEEILRGLGLCHELVRSAWDIVDGRVEGTLSDAQKSYIKGSSEGLQKYNI